MSATSSPLKLSRPVGNPLSSGCAFAYVHGAGFNPTAVNQPLIGTNHKSYMKIKTLMLAVVPLVAGLATGCSTVINTPQGKILSVTERGLGFEMAQSPQTQSPEVKFGFFSSAVVIIPTATNAPVNSPNFANNFSFDQTGALQLGIGENIAAGNYQTSQPGPTNSAVTTQPVVPK